MSDQNSENLGGNGVCGAISGSEVDREGLGGGMTSGGSVVWGPAIAVDGERPGWLCSGEWRRVRTLAVGEWQTADIESPGDTIPDMDEWNWGDISHIRLPADHPHYRQPASIPGSLEAAAQAALKMQGYGTPQPTPQADTKPDVTARMTLAEAEARGELCGCCTGREGYVQCLRDLGLILPEPVDPDEAEAQKLNNDSPYDLTGLDDEHAARNVRYIGATILAAIKRGRELALAEETGK